MLSIRSIMLGQSVSAQLRPKDMHNYVKMSGSSGIHPTFIKRKYIFKSDLFF